MRIRNSRINKGLGFLLLVKYLSVCILVVFLADNDGDGQIS